MAKKALLVSIAFLLLAYPGFVAAQSCIRQFPNALDQVAANCPGCEGLYTNCFEGCEGDWYFCSEEMAAACYFNWEGCVANCKDEWNNCNEECWAPLPACQAAGPPPPDRDQCMEDCQAEAICGDGICQDVTCAAIGCPEPETPENCPEDCEQSSGKCWEMDGGKDYYVMGTMYPACPQASACPNCSLPQECAGKTDVCIDEQTLLEYSCENPEGEQYACPNGCQNEACISPA